MTGESEESPSFRARSMKGASSRLITLESLIRVFPVGTSTNGSIPLTCNKRILFPFRISAVCGGSSWFKKSIRAVGTMVRKMMMKAKNCWCYIFCWLGFWKMRQMYGSICQMQKQRQKLLKIFFILNPSMILTVETIVKIVKTRYGLYALRCVEGYAGIDYIQSISLPRSLPQITLISFCPPDSNILCVLESHHSTKGAHPCASSWEPRR